MEIALTEKDAQILAMAKLLVGENQRALERAQGIVRRESASLTRVMQPAASVQVVEVPADSDERVDNLQNAVAMQDQITTQHHSDIEELKGLVSIVLKNARFIKDVETENA